MRLGEDFSMRLKLDSEADTKALGNRLGANADKGVYISLEGEIGSGKTTLARGFFQACGIRENIKSPTYSLVESYQNNGKLFFHFDFYRLTSPNEFLEAGLNEYFESPNTCIVEWPERLAHLMRTPDITVRLEYSESHRIGLVSYNTETGYDCLSYAKLIER